MHDVILLAKAKSFPSDKRLMLFERNLVVSLRYEAGLHNNSSAAGEWEKLVFFTEN